MGAEAFRAVKFVFPAVLAGQVLADPQTARANTKVQAGLLAVQLAGMVQVSVMPGDDGGGTWVMPG